MHINLGLDSTIRRQIADQLGLILADLYVLYTKTLNFHWNIIDPRFYSLHKMLEDQYEKLEEQIDEVAERIRMLGERTPAQLKQFIKMTSLKESDGILEGDAMILDLLNDHEAIIRNLRKQIDLFSELGDEGSADLLIQSIRFHEKIAWMLRSHLGLEKTSSSKKK